MFQILLWMAIWARCQSMALNLDLSIPYRYQTTIPASPASPGECSFNVLPNRFVMLSVNSSTVNATLMGFGGTGGSGPTGVIPGTISQRDGSTTIAIYPPKVNLANCTGSSGCSFHLILTPQTGTVLSVDVTQGSILTPGAQEQSGYITRSKSIFYGVIPGGDDLPLDITLTPATDLYYADLDLFVYEGWSFSPSSIRFPSTSSSNHYKNTPETATITSLSSLAPINDLFIVEIYSTYFASPTTSYSISFSKNGEPDSATSSVVDMSTVWLTAACIIFTLCVVSAAIMFFRMRVVLIRRILDADPRALEALAEQPGVGVTQAQLKRMSISRFKPSMFPADDAKCSICLGEYEAADRLITLPCAHHFHGECIGPWVERKHRCPLCRQHLDTAETKQVPAQVFEETLEDIESQSAVHNLEDIELKSVPNAAPKRT